MKYHQDATAITTQDAAVNHQSHVLNSINEVLTSDVKMKETEEASWSKTSSPSLGVFGIKTYLSGVSAGATDVIPFGTYILTYTIQFRFRVVSSSQLLLEPPKPSVSISTSAQSNSQVAHDEKEIKICKMGPTPDKHKFTSLPDRATKTLSDNEYVLPRVVLGGHQYVRVQQQEPCSPVPYPVKITDKC